MPSKIPYPDPARPFPALTPAQRYHFDVYGYVIVPNVFTLDECGAMRESLQRIKRELEAIKDPAQRVVRHAYFQTDQPHHKYIVAIAQCDPTLLGYTIHPRVVGMSEEVIGGKSHLLESNAHINRRAPEWPMQPDGTPKFGLHRGLPAHEGHSYYHGLYHSSFVKVLTNLTDLGPDDGGTVVIPGSHKIDVPKADIIAAAYEDRSLLHQVIAPAGSSLLFTEALLHATGRITSDNERVIIIAGYGTAFMPFKFMESHRPDFRVEPEFIASLPEHAKHLFVSDGYIERFERYRKLGDAVGAANGAEKKETPELVGVMK